MRRPQKRPKSFEEMQKPRKPKVAFQPEVYHGMQRGINLIARAVRPTLGPLPRLAVLENTMRSGKPEILDSGGIIARRVIELKEREEDVGAMFLRQMLWHQYDKMGDGTATACVIFQVLFDEAVRLMAAGCNAQRLRYHLEQAERLALSHLTSQVTLLNSQKEIADLAESLCYDYELAVMLGEIFDIVGENGEVDVRKGRGRNLERDFIEGSFYTGGVISTVFSAGEPNQRVDLENCAVFISDLDFKEVENIVPVIDCAYRAGIRSLAVVGKEMSDKVISVLQNARRKTGFHVIGVKAPDVLAGQPVLLQDIAILTGGQVFTRETGNGAVNVKEEDFGWARRIWATKEYFGIVRGKGAPRQVRMHIALLRRALDATQDADARRKLRERMAHLMGGSAVLWVGAVSEPMMEARVENGKRTVSALRSALLNGVLPGGGAALLNCRKVLLENIPVSDEVEAAAAYRILARALEEPTRTILKNAGYEPAPYIQEIEKAGTGFGFDVRSGQVVAMQPAGILDAYGVLHSALFEAVSSAALAITVDVVVYHKLPKVTLNP
jgi:chaperonin GroEL